MMRFWNSIAWLVVSLASVTGAAEQEERRPPSAMFNGRRAGKALPAVDLPAHVSAPQGKLTLWADFAHAELDRVPLYLVNRTDTTQSLSSQDNDLYIKLEYKNPEGKWLRGQAHLFGFCGNSYYGLTLSPGQFFAFDGYRAKEGEKHKVRYASVRDATLVSNEGEGLISETDVMDAAKDAFAGSAIPGTIRWRIESKGDVLSDRDHGWLDRAAAMRTLVLMERNEAAIEWVRVIKRLLESQPDADDVKEARVAADEVLAYSWPAHVAPEVLLNRCLKAVSTEGQAKPKAGTLESAPKLLWPLLSELLGENAPPPWRAIAKQQDFRSLKPLFVNAAKTLLEGPDDLVFPAMAVLGNGRIADEVISTSEFENWLLSPKIRMQTIAARALARRSEWQRLSELGMKLPPEGQIIVLRELAFGGRDQFGGRKATRNPDSPAEEMFWIQCVKAQPLEAASALWSFDFLEARNPFNYHVHDPLRDYLKTEAEKAAKIDTSYDLGPDAQKLVTAVQMLGTWRVKDDIPIFNLLAKHPGTTRNGGLVIQYVARKALIMQGAPVPNE